MYKRQLLANVWLGARRGLVGALYGVIGRIGMIAASVAAAKYTAPYIAQWVVVPAVGQLFEKQAALKTAEGVLDGLRQTVTEAAVGMSESIAFSMLVVLFSVLFGRLIWIFGRSLKLIAVSYTHLRREVMNVVRELNRKFGITVILITHHMDEAVQAQRVVCLLYTSRCV